MIQKRKKKQICNLTPFSFSGPFVAAAEVEVFFHLLHFFSLEDFLSCVNCMRDSFTVNYGGQHLLQAGNITTLGCRGI